MEDAREVAESRGLNVAAEDRLETAVVEVRVDLAETLPGMLLIDISQLSIGSVCGIRRFFGGICDRDRIVPEFVSSHDDRWCVTRASPWHYDNLHPTTRESFIVYYLLPVLALQVSNVCVFPIVA